ncbi:hypothetical protein [Anditalea andensis]|uniref:Uncharacterized protein n=1 Tax=Anditalea andensis TaxID=1048983 RepID=A0A074L1X8_9BACT|nr:hypothetical protein [Anditalea andensis]KEO75139.1 hypothetical protein EL17_05580 [Anditalea andensis]
MKGESMANSNKNIDKQFRDQLENHEIKPSGLAWERLEKKLDQNKKPAYPWMKVAASVMLLLTMGSLIWLSIDFTKSKVELPLAQVEDIPADVPSEKAIEEETPKISEEPKASAPAPRKPSATAPVKETETSKPNLVAENEAPVIKEKSAITPIETIERVQPEVSLPSSGEVYLAEHRPEVRVKIISSGIVEKPQKENLIDDLGEKIEKVGSLINKVDQGLADLQDAKNNLFASITSRRERNSN